MGSVSARNERCVFERMSAVEDHIEEEPVHMKSAVEANEAQLAGLKGETYPLRDRLD